MESQHQLHTYEAPEPGTPETLVDEQDYAIRPRKRLLDETEMDITPMIDMTFLLLIFFILSSRIDTQGDVDLPKAMYATSAVLDKCVILTVTPGGADDSAQIFKGDSTDDAQRIQGSPDDQAAEIADYLDKELTGDKIYVVIKASKGVKHKEVSRVSEAVAQIEAVQALYVAVLDGGS